MDVRVEGDVGEPSGSIAARLRRTDRESVKTLARVEVVAHDSLDEDGLSSRDRHARHLDAECPPGSVQTGKPVACGRSPL